MYILLLCLTFKPILFYFSCFLPFPHWHQGLTLNLPPLIWSFSISSVSLTWWQHTMQYVYGSLALLVLIIGNPIQLQLSISRALCWTPASFKLERAPGYSYRNPPYWSCNLISHLSQSLGPNFPFLMTSSPTPFHSSSDLVVFKWFW